MSAPYLLDTADITWQDNTPYSNTYKDIYWLPGEALAEKQYVFIDPVKELLEQAGQLTTRFQFSVGELGFGFATNCLLMAEHWEKTQSNDSLLNFVSIEKHPVAVDVLRKHLAQFSFKHTEALLTQYPPPYVGQHVIWLSRNIRLLLIFDDADTALANLDASVDAWFLDGFSPAKNLDMWDEQICKKLFSKSKPGAIVTTYAAAGKVRRALQDNGFETEKRTGYGSKKEMLAASRRGEWQPSAYGQDSFAVVGGGLAGYFCAEALQRRGLNFVLLDADGNRASDIPQLTVLPQLAVAAEAKHRFSLLAFQYMQLAPGFHATGLTWHGRSEDETIRLQKTAGQFPDDLLQVQDDQSVRFAQAGWFSFRELKQAVNVNPLKHTIDKLVRHDQQWSCEAGGESVAIADQVILATGSDTGLLGELPVDAIRGQAISIGTDCITEVLNGDVTIFPTRDGQSVVSGTYARSDNLEVDTGDTDRLLETAGKYLGQAPEVESTYVGIRAVSRDRLPIVDMAPNWDALTATTINRVSGFTDYQEGLGICTAFGSRGATHARLCAEHLVTRLLGEPAALSLTHQRMLAATRFAIRDARQKS